MVLVMVREEGRGGEAVAIDHNYTGNGGSPSRGGFTRSDNYLRKTPVFAGVLGGGKKCEYFRRWGGGAAQESVAHLNTGNGDTHEIVFTVHHGSKAL